MTVANDPEGLITAPPVTDHEYDVTGVEDDAVYRTAELDLHTLLAPVTVGTAGREVTAKHRCNPKPQLLAAATQMLAELEVKADVKFTLMEVPDELITFTPDGTVQLYEVAAETGEIEYVTLVNPHKPLPGPVILPGCTGVLNTWNDLLYPPQTFNAVTVIVPEVQFGPKLITCVLAEEVSVEAPRVALPVTDH